MSELFLKLKKYTHGYLGDSQVIYDGPNSGVKVEDSSLGRKRESERAYQ